MTAATLENDTVTTALPTLRLCTAGIAPAA